MARGDIPAITWGAGFANTIDRDLPIDHATVYSVPRQGSVLTEVIGGARDAWITGTSHILAGDFRWIPIADTTGPAVTGWDGATGWRAFLEWAKEGNIFRLVHDKNVPATYTPMYLLEPFGTNPGIKQERIFRYRSVHMKMRSSDDSVITGY